MYNTNRKRDNRGNVYNEKRAVTV